MFQLLSHRLRPLLLLAVLVGAGTPAWAQPLPKPQPQPRAPAQAPKPQRAHDPQRSLPAAVRRAERAGQVLSAEHVQYDGRDVNRVKIVDDRGRVKVYWDDPAAARKADDGDADSQQPRDRRPRSRTRHDDDGDPTL